MALINCSDCGAEVSDRAGHCIKCGAPMAEERRSAGVGLTTIQETSKKLKAHSMLSFFALVIGLILMTVGSQPPANANVTGFGALLFSAGVLWYIVTKFRAWWNHG